MVAKYAKNKYCRPGERNYGQAKAAQQDAIIVKKKAEAYNTLINSWPACRPPFGVYRNLRGDFLQIVKAGDDFMRQDFPASQQELESGHLWMPKVALGFPGTRFHEESQYGFDEFAYVLVEPIDIGFNQVAADGMMVYQRKPIIISTNATMDTVWEAVSTDQFDPCQEYFSVLPNGDIQRYPARSFLPTPSPTPSPNAALILPISPRQQLDTAGKVLPFFRPDCDGNDFSVGYDNPVGILGGGGEDFSLGNAIAAPSLDDGADILFGDDNSAVTLPDGLQHVADFNNLFDVGYASAQG